MRYFVTIDGVEHCVEVAERPGGPYLVSLLDPDAGPSEGADTAGRPVDAQVIRAGPGPLTLRVDGQIFDMVIDGEPPNVHVFASGRRASVGVESARMRAAANVRGGAGGSGDGIVASPMPGKVVKVLVSVGDTVDAGSPLVVVEAMKMENELVAETAGTVKKVHVAPGDAVEGGAPLVAVG